MTLRGKALWLGVSVLAAVALGNLARALDPRETISSLWLLVAALCVYALGYRFYASFLARRVLRLDPDRPTAAVLHKDGVDYHPTNRWVLFGHHFAAISGAGPIIGPTLAAQFGFLPGFLWILVGATLGGAVQDLVILTASVRRDGRSIATVVRDEVGPTAGLLVAVVILFNIVVVVSGSALTVVNALEASPWGAFTTLCIVPIALFFGWYLRFLRPGRIREVSLMGAALLPLAVYAGSFVPGSALAPWFTLGKERLVLGLALLSLLSSMLPVWLLLLSRDCISSYLKVGTFVLLAVGILALAPPIRMPAVTPFIHGGGPVIPGKVYPFLFITIACGAISGFHSLIATGTTPKLVASEGDLPLVGFGAMLTESLVAVLCLIAATAMLPGDYFAINSHLSAEALTRLGFPPQKVGELAAAMGTTLTGRPGGSVSLAVGMTQILAPLLGGRAAMAYLYNFCLMFQALFILTLVDAGTRVGRFLLQEMAGQARPGLAGRRGWVNTALTSLIIVASWSFLIWTGSVATIWPMFGVANQTLAATAFAVATTLLLKAGQARYAWTTFLPMVFMAVTSLTAAAQLVARFWVEAGQAATVTQAMGYRVDLAFVILLAALAVTILATLVRQWPGLLRHPVER